MNQLQLKIQNPLLANLFTNFQKYLVKKIIMTGTPVDNRPQDIWSQVFFLDSKSLGRSFSTFKDKYDSKKELSESSAYSA